MAIDNGDSEIDSVVLSLPDYGKEIKNWQSYSLSSNFVAPCDKWTFRISGEDTTLYQELLVPGAKVQMSINGLIQCTGYIDDRNIRYDRRAGTIITVTGRDILSRLVNANADAKFRLKSDMTVADLIAPVLSLYDLGQLYNSEGTHLNVVTGRPNSESLKATTYQVQEITYEKGSNGLLVVDGNGKYVSSLQSKTVTEIVANLKPGLKKIPIKQMKCHPGEGAYAFIAKMIAREGLMLKAVADGSGLMAVAPTFDGPIYYKIINKKVETGKNNVISCDNDINWAEQPSIIIAEGIGGGSEFGKSALKVVMVNELTALDDSGNYLPEVQNVMAQYQHALLVPIRPQVIPSKNFLATKHAFCPMYIKDDESKTLDQLKYFVTRKMAEHQMKALTVKYTVLGHTYFDGSNDIPWAVNTLVDVDDDILNIHEAMWCLSRTFKKSRNEGTITELELIRPHTLLIG